MLDDATLMGRRMAGAGIGRAELFVVEQHTDGECSFRLTPEREPT